VDVPSLRIGGPQYSDDTVRDAAIHDALHEHGVDLVLLLGYMKLLGPRTVEAYRGRILNTHPALLPKFGGKGMYGGRVHEAVLHAHETETGVTVHVVDERYDQGPIVAQATVPVFQNDTAATLAERVMDREREFLVETLQQIVSGQVSLDQL
jgi:phosphoribosylglycinamide formyltransferase-1